MRRGDGLIKALVAVGILTVAVGFWVALRHPEPRWPLATGSAVR